MKSADSQAFSPVKEVVSEQRQGGKSPAYLPAQKQGRQQGHTKTFRGKHSASCVFFSPLFLPTFVASL